MRSLRLLGAFVVALNAASAQGVVRRDSAGIRIVGVPGSVLDRLPMWRLDGPTVRIEPSMGIEYELNRAGSPWQLSDGRIVVANNTVELRFYDRDGRYLNTVARRGRGPGEYEQLLRVVRVTGDTLLAWDVPSRRIDVRDSNGKLVRAFSTPRMARFAGVGGRGAVFEEYTFPELQQTGLKQDTILVRQWREDSTGGDVVARLPGTWMDVVRAQPNGGFREVRLSGSQMLAGGARGSVFVHGDNFTVYWFGDGGRLGTITRVNVPRTRVTAADREAEDHRFRDLLARNRGVRVNPGQPASVYAPYRPQVSGLAFDSEGRAWLRRWNGYGSRNAEWIVFEQHGTPIARITMPGTFQPNDVGLDYALGLLTDDDGVQSLHKYRIVR